MKTYDILNAGPKNRFMANGKIVSNSGRHIQLQNLPKNHIPTLKEARELLKMGAFDMLETVYGDTQDILSQLLRTMLIPKPGHEFIIVDFSAIEARVIAWLAGEQWRLEAFRNGEDIYCALASAMFGVPVVKGGVNGELRTQGKIAELACIAFNSLVLTDCGLVPIQNVTVDMRVWDGQEWVNHDGVVYMGEREVINYEGLTATPEHLVWIEGKSEPIPFEIAAASGRKLICTGNNGEAVRVSGNYFGENNLSEKTDKCTARVYDIRNAGRHHSFTVSGHLVHNCGYGGGVGALKAFGASDMGISEEKMAEIIGNWRQANPAIVKFWWDLEGAAIQTIKDHQERNVGKIGIRFYANTLWLILPSGRSLAYISPTLEPNRFGTMSMAFMGLNTANKWSCTESYGGRLAENVTQSTARDLLAEAMWRMEQKALDIVSHIHDEIVLEVPKDSISVEEVCKIMNQSPAWASGLPLSSAGYKGDFYYKD